LPGAGPPGLVARITPARYGIDGLVIDRTDEISILSRALVMTTRSMELLRAWGLEDDVRTGAADVEPRRVGYAVVRFDQDDAGVYTVLHERDAARVRRDEAVRRCASSIDIR
jgi:2-polyprenyl-6-methoxyphenol hydroxylase-like FAD-dependent oxidoreductase